MNKILTVSIAAYNVERFIENTLKSLLVNKIDDLEILVEDDGGTDKTANIVEKFEHQYPDIVKLVHKENKGYGSTVNKSIELAQGKYFKQLDGDDWYDSGNFEKLLELLRTIEVDALYSPYIEYKEGKGQKKIVDYFEKDIDGVYKLEDIISKSKHYLIMHTLLYKTEVLKKCKLKLLEHCFYTDTQYAMFPLVNIDTIFITHLPIYIYRIGREEQSISLSSHRKHYEDYIKVSERIIEFYNQNKDNLSTNKKDYIFKYVRWHISNTITGFLIILKPDKNNLRMIKEFEDYILKNNEQIYNSVKELSKIVRTLRRTKYNYIIYKLISFLKILKKYLEQK